METERFRPFSAVHLFLVRNDQILLSRRYNTGYEDGNYSLVAGHIDGGETVRNAMVREAKEEAGITMKPEQLDIAHVMHRMGEKREAINWFFTTAHWQGDVMNCELDKCDDLSWFPIDKLPDNTIPYIESAIENWQQGCIFSEFGWNAPEQIRAF